MAGGRHVGPLIFDVDKEQQCGGSGALPHGAHSGGKCTSLVTKWDQDTSTSIAADLPTRRGRFRKTSEDVSSACVFWPSVLETDGSGGARSGERILTSTYSGTGSDGHAGAIVCGEVAVGRQGGFRSSILGAHIGRI